jgi:hypothetical protein
LTDDGSMAFVIDDVREIAAPSATVWEVITDLPAYPEWNPFVVACRSTLVVGEPIAMRVRLLPWFTQPQTETVLEHVPGERLSYGLDGGALGAVASRRSHELHALGPGRTRYRSHFELSGWLASVVRGLLGANLKRGFHAMADAIQERAERHTTETR